MSAVVTSLWPDDIRVDVLTPLAILRLQAAALGRITKGVLEAEVVTTTGHDDFVVHRLEIVAPQLGGRRYGVMSATHRTDFYPVVLEAECFRPPRKPSGLPAGALASTLSELASPASDWPPPNDWRPVAGDQNEFLRRLGEVLKSRQVRAAIDSLLALSNEKAQPAEAETAA